MNRREFFDALKSKSVRWVPWLAPLGFSLREHIYRASTGPYKVIWVEWFGKPVGWLNEAGKIIWL